MAYRKKAAALLVHRPDLAVISECEHPSKLIFPEHVQRPSAMVWIGDNVNKGLGIFSYCSYGLRKIRSHDETIKLVAPVEVTGDGEKFTLIGIWANNPGDPDGAYVAQVWKAIHKYAGRIRSSNTLLAGDFNSNTIFDRKYRVGNHSHVVDTLAARGIHSVYHRHHNQEHGKEAIPTQFMYRHRDKPLHLDYCFASSDFYVKNVEIGKHEEWSIHSDHMPVMVEFEKRR